MARSTTTAGVLCCCSSQPAVVVRPGDPCLRSFLGSLHSLVLDCWPDLAPAAVSSSVVSAARAWGGAETTFLLRLLLFLLDLALAGVVVRGVWAVVRLGGAGEQIIRTWLSLAS